MAQSETKKRVTVSTQIEISVVDSGLSITQICELEARLQKIPGVWSSSFSAESIVLHPSSSQYVLPIQTEVMNTIKNHFQFALHDDSVAVDWT